MTAEIAPILASTTIRPLTPQTCATSSTTRHASRKPRPGPPYAFGMVIPKNPASFSAFTFSHGYCSDRSTSAARGVLGTALDFVEVTGVLDGLLLVHVGLPGIVPSRGHRHHDSLPPPFTKRAEQAFMGKRISRCVGLLERDRAQGGLAGGVIRPM